MVAWTATRARTSPSVSTGKLLKGWGPRLLSAALALSTFSAPAPAVAKLMGELGTQFVDTGNIEGWNVWHTPDGTCGSEVTDDSGTTFSVVTAAAAPDRMVIAVSNASWRSIAAGQHYSLTLMMDGHDQMLDAVGFNGTASPNDPSLGAKVDLKWAFDNMSKGHHLSVLLDKKPLAYDVKVPLRAVAWVMSCSAGTGDPFRGR